MSQYQGEGCEVNFICQLGGCLWMKLTFKLVNFGASLVVLWLRIHLPMQGTWVRPLVWEDPTCRGATKPMRPNH